MRILSCILLISNLVWATNGQRPSRAVKVGEDGMRRSAYVTVMPAFPKNSRSKGAQGVAIVEVEYDGSGNVSHVEILEAPDTQIGDAVVKAVQQWKFRRSTLKGQALSVKGKLTFYYTIDRRGRARVENPKQY